MAQSLVRSRSATCGTACRSSPCTLRRIRYAERQLEAEPVLVSWAELSVMCHLIGEPMPFLTAGMLDALARFESQHRECTLSHAVDRAVEERSLTFARQLGPADLAVHVNTALNAAVTGDDAADHSCDWRRWRIDVGAGTSERRLVLLGANRPSRLETAIGCSIDDPAWSIRLAEHLQDFAPSHWPIRYLGGGR
ncbi:hypothetical protein [Microlunatus speluncae]|uniref:hypothetical protein n=1 Tax=Microlunatus speluncae TaxID=2594267 RepID=UPI00126638EA|nr:hypothetical protein [Microlunatus speluncae]